MPLIRKNKKLQKSRYEIVKTWMSSFVVTVAAVVAVVVFVPKSPEAHILKYTPLENEIAYQVKVTDEDHALDEETLKMVLENQMTYLELPLTLGESSGIFDGLMPNTEYRLSVYGSKGFGLERLDSVIVKTEDRAGGFILGYRKIGEDWEPSYEVDVLVNDPESIYSQITLYYGYQSGDQMFYNSVPVTLPEETLVLFHLFSRTHVYIEGITVDGSVVLDELWISPPFVLESSVYLDYRDSHEIGYTLYHSANQDVEVTYTFDLFEGSKKIASQSVIGSYTAHDGLIIIFDELKSLGLYNLVVTARYINPDTLQEENIIIHEEEIETLGYYEVDVTVIEFETYLEVTMTVIDPSHYFQVPYYDIYEVSGEFPNFVASEIFDFTPGVDSKSVSFTVPIPDIGENHIVIGIRNQNDSTIRHIIYDEIINKE
ncbi:MAG: hypothetical protein RBQ71_06090 [Acholeplasmataceae bacterium]|jgi:hypothetical protein|nr:hypothetical protein [Acholeplasmataceae bacterium]